MRNIFVSLTAVIALISVMSCQKSGPAAPAPCPSCTATPIPAGSVFTLDNFEDGDLLNCDKTKVYGTDKSWDGLEVMGSGGDVLTSTGTLVSTPGNASLYCMAVTISAVNSSSAAVNTSAPFFTTMHPRNFTNGQYDMFMDIKTDNPGGLTITAYLSGPCVDNGAGGCTTEVAASGSMYTTSAWKTMQICLTEEVPCGLVSGASAGQYTVAQVLAYLRSFLFVASIDLMPLESRGITIYIDNVRFVKR